MRPSTSQRRDSGCHRPCHRPLLRGAAGALPEDAVSVRTSSGQRYLSVTIVVWVDDRSQLERVYNELKAESEVLLYI